MKRYPEEVQTFIEQHVQGTTTRDLVELVNAQFGPLFTESKMKAYKSNHNLKSGTPLGVLKGTATKRYPEHIRNYIMENHKGIGPKDMTELLNNTFGTDYKYKQIRAYYKNYNLKSGIDRRFKKGHIPANKGKKGHCAPGSEKTWFPKGHVPAGHKPVGSERVDTDGYTLIKTAEPNIWVPKHKVIWEAENGKVPDEYILTFLDGDKSNITLDNIALVTRAESLEITRSRLRSSNPEFTKTGILIAKVKIAGNKLKGAK